MTEQAASLDPGTGHRRARGVATIPLSLFGITLGLAGLAGAWRAADQLLGAPFWVGESFYAISAALWLLFTGLYLVTGLPKVIGGDARNPILGPFLSLIPLVSILLTSHYAEYVPTIGFWACLASVVVWTLVCGDLVAHWMRGGVVLASVHPGYFIPVVAGPFIASIGLSEIGIVPAAIAAFGVGVFFWVVVGAGVVVRLMNGAELPDAAKPTLSAFLAASATAGVAWIAFAPGDAGGVLLALSGIVVMMLVVQFFLIPYYARLRFGLSFWIFTFPLASSANFVVRLLAQSGPPGWEIAAWVVLATVTVLIGVIGIRSLVLWVRPRPTPARERVTETTGSDVP